MLKKLAFFAAATALPLAAASAQDTAQPTTSPETAAPAQPGVTQPAPAETPAQPDAAAPADAPMNDATAPAEEAAPAADGGPIVATTAADFSAGASVYDPQGGAVGTVESSTATDVIVSTGTNRVQLPLSSFGKNNRGLVIALTKAQLDAQAAAATPQQ